MGDLNPELMPYKSTEENRKYQREWARRNGKTKKCNQAGPKVRKQMVEDAKAQPCYACGKEFPFQAMDLHHLDPTTKVAGIAELQRVASYVTLQEEIDKCVPLCAICHRLFHAGLVTLPS